MFYVSRMPRKRKSGAPQRADASKRQQMSWNMYDLANQNLTVVANDDPSLAAESMVPAIENAHGLSNTERPSTSADVTQSVDCDTHAEDIRDHDDVYAMYMMDECDYRLRVHDGVSAKASDWHCHLGSFSVQLSALQSRQEARLSQSLAKFPGCWLYVNSTNRLLLVFFELDQDKDNSDMVVSNSMCFQVSTDLPLQCLEALRMKCFCMTLDKYDSSQRHVHIAVHALQGTLTKPKFWSDGARPKKAQLALQHLMGYFYGLAPLGKLYICVLNL